MQEAYDSIYIITSKYGTSQFFFVLLHEIYHTHLKTIKTKTLEFVTLSSLWSRGAYQAENSNELV